MQADRSLRIRAVSADALALAGLVAATVAGCNEIFNGKTCSSEGRLYRPGDAISFSSGCGGCSCGDNGEILCPPGPCFIEPDPDCRFDTTYTYGYDGGLGAYRDLVTLAPVAAFSLERTSYVVQLASAQCVPALPACHDAAQLDASDVVVDLRHPDVQAALALSTPPFYGHDSRPVDGVAFQLLRADGRGFLVGDACRADEACTPTPAGVQKLVDDLQALQGQQLLDPSCAAIASPTPARP
jgi:hypothetical protein